MFSVITSKIFAGTSLVLLLAAGGMWWYIGNLNDTIEGQRNTIATLNAEKAVQNAAIARMGQEAERQRQAFDSAVEQGQQTIREAQGRVTVVRQTERNGCPTPPQIMGIGL